MRFTVGVLGQTLLPKFVNPKSIARIISSLEKVEARGQFNLIDEMRAAVSTLRLPGKCFFISDCLYDEEEIIRAFDVVRSRNFELAVLQVLEPGRTRTDFQRHINVCRRGDGRTTRPRARPKFEI